MSANGSGERPFHPWETPSLGSAGDAWDRFVDLPEEAADVVKRGKERARRETEYQKALVQLAGGRQHRKPLNQIATVAWVMVALAATTTAPLLFLRPIFALLALAGSAGSLAWLIRKKPYERGIWHSAIAALLAIALLAWHFRTHFIQQ